MAALAERLETLTTLTEQTDTRVPPELTERARRVAARATQRMQIGEQTVVALAGATGSGKSSLFNALAEAPLAEQGARRPTTSQTLAVSFGPSNTKLLDWLEIKRRNEVPATDSGLANLILLDLPDHDSTATAHREEVDKMVRVVDQFIWVLDPQKYADAAVHERYLRPLAEHRDVITVVLNQAARLSPAELEQCLKDLRLLLNSDGLHDVPVLATSALTGQGVAELRARLAELAERKTAAAARLGADLDVLAAEFAEHTLGESSGKPVSRTLDSLTDSLALAAGVPVVTNAVRTSMTQRGTLATGWPLVKWIAGLRPDPLKRLRIGVGRDRPAIEAELPERSSLPKHSDVADARLKTALRTLATELGQGMPTLWQAGVHRAVHSNASSLPDSLDRAIVTTDLGTDRQPAWWQLLRVLQWLLIITLVIGVGWLTLNAVLGYFGLPGVPGVEVGFEDGLQVPLPTALALGSVAAGVVLSLISRVFVGLGARSAERRARRRLHDSIEEVGKTEVLTPVKQELARYREAGQLVEQLR